MQYFLKKLLLIALRALVYLKRALVWLGQKLLRVFEAVYTLYQSTIGLALYKLGFRLQKKMVLSNTGRKGRTVDFFGKRSTLQIVLFLVAIIVMIPHSKLYTRDIGDIPGKQTILYKVIGPTQEFGEIEEVSADTTGPLTEVQSAWRERSVSVDMPATPSSDIALGPQEISSITSGGSAITKPTILPGTELPSTPDAPQRNRTQIIYYTVEPGDTIGAIAEKYGLQTATVLWANDLNSRSYIRPGDKLTILPVDGVIHKVKSGDTLNKIAKLYDAQVEGIIKQNKLKNDGSDIVIGEELLVPGGEKPQPAYTAPTRRYTSLSSVAAPPSSISAPAGSGWLWPTSVRHITQYFGWRHSGVDIAGPVGTPLYASKAGTVIKASLGWNGGYGNYVIIDHGGGFQTLYGHASRLYVSTGQRVAQGQTIAAMGSTGRSTGPHVHFEVRVNGRMVNPFQYIR